MKFESYDDILINLETLQTYFKFNIFNHKT